MTFEDEIKELLSYVIMVDGELITLDSKENMIIELKNKHCLDKQKVKDAIDKMINNKDITLSEHQQYAIVMMLKQLKKELFGDEK